jgi:hypothetical protein
MAQLKQPRSSQHERHVRPHRYYFAGVAFFLPFAAGGCVFSVARRSRLRSRFFALDRLRVFSRALSFGMVGLLIEKCKSSSILPCYRNVRAGVL